MSSSMHWLAAALLTVGAVGLSRALAAESSLREDLKKLPPLTKAGAGPVEDDWLVATTPHPAKVYRSPDGKGIVLDNGLIRRMWRLEPDAATVAFDNLMTDQPVIRAVKPEAILTINQVPIKVGGLAGQPNNAYLRHEWLDGMRRHSNALHFVRFEIGPTRERLAWKRKRYSSDAPWPPPGAGLTLHFQGLTGTGPAGIGSLQHLAVTVHYELYDNIPVLAKWLTISNGAPEPVTLNTFASELLAAVEYESVVDKRERWEYPNIHVQSDYSFRGMDAQTANQTTHWILDPEFKTQVSSSSTTPCLLESRPPVGPGVILKTGETFETFRTFELIHDSTDRERKGLAVRQMYRRLAPWVTENPIMMHVRSAKPEAIRLAIDQCATVGFEIVIISFWSGFNMENEDPAYLGQFKQLTDYAHSKGVELGAYSLLASRSVGPRDDIVDPTTGKPGGVFGASPCIGSNWGKDYFRKLYAFFEKTGMDLLEHDGSYPGDVCGSTNHPGHAGFPDSQWTQWKTITDFYNWCRRQGIYLNVPDSYYLNGSSKCGMGYRESNWSLPRAQQLIHARQNIYDGTWEKTPSMGWMMVPLVEYGGGGPAATIEPLAEHLDHYELTLANNFGAGVQACYRGPRLFDTDQTRDVVRKWVSFYKKHRAILDSDIIHGRRADGRDLDFLVHVNPHLKEKALIMVFNPLDQPARKTLKVPLYYSGLTRRAQVSKEEATSSKAYTLDRDYSIQLPVEMPPQSVSWFIVR